MVVQQQPEAVMRPLTFFVAGTVIAALVVGVGSNRIGELLGGIDKSCQGYALARKASDRDLEPYVVALVSYVVARNLVQGDTRVLEKDLSENQYLQDAVAWLDEYCPSNVEDSFATALKLMVKEVEAD
jgi:hypothetical protein|tara:strand:- start:638 stop:1021 length:384 start_codon:yes stop_codon:yes gene_type:complete